MNIYNNKKKQSIKYQKAMNKIKSAKAKLLVGILDDTNQPLLDLNQL